MRHQTTDPALDFQGNVIKDENGNVVRVMDVQAYKNRLEKDPDVLPWWAGLYTPQKGYYFTESGAHYCDGDDLGLSAAIELLQDSTSPTTPDNEINSIIIRPHAFDGNPQPNSYREANELLEEGKNIARAVPKSATLVHELFHLIRGDDFLAANKEFCKWLAPHVTCRVDLRMILTAIPADDLAKCIDLAGKRPRVARTNPENYVFFIAHMYHMRGG